MTKTMERKRKTSSLDANPCRFALAFVHSLSGERYDNLLDIPCGAYLDMSMDEQTYDDDEPLFMPREAALRLAAHYNAHATPEGEYGYWRWHIVLEITNRCRWTNVTLCEHGQGRLDITEVPIKVVRPTAQERREIGSRKAVRA